MAETDKETWISPRKAKSIANREAFELYLLTRDVEHGFCARCGRPDCTTDHEKG
ncbi:hypothetical protein AHiyo6_00980 [Arthrobacter sp. Hiyo6]|nr:hypothetical protein AHiyo6_00980 [Arthrobacter sp. Hiyo6]